MRRFLSVLLWWLGPTKPCSQHGQVPGWILIRCHNCQVDIGLFTQAFIPTFRVFPLNHIFRRRSTRGTRTSSAPSSSRRHRPMSLTRRRRWGREEGCLRFCQARTFYQSCVRERETTAPEDLLNLQAVLEFAGGWELSGSQNASMLLSERMFRLQNKLGLSPKPLLPSFQECPPSSRGE